MYRLKYVLFINIFLFLSIFNQACAEKDPDKTLFLQASEVKVPEDNVFFYRLPIISFSFYDDLGNRQFIDQEIVDAFSGLLNVQEIDYVDIKNENNFLVYKSINGFFGSQENTIKDFLYRNMASVTESCMKTIAIEDSMIFENYILDVTGEREGNTISNAVDRVRPIADEMYVNYINNLCRIPSNDYSMNGVVREYLTQHITALLEASTVNDIVFDSDLTSLSQVFRNLYLSESGIYIRIISFIMIERFRQSVDQMVGSEDEKIIRDLFNVNFENYYSFLQDESIPSNVRHDVAMSCDDRALCIPLLTEEFNINSCINENLVIEIIGFGSVKYLMIVD